MPSCFPFSCSYLFSLYSWCTAPLNNMQWLLALCCLQYPAFACLPQVEQHAFATAFLSQLSSHGWKHWLQCQGKLQTPCIWGIQSRAEHENILVSLSQTQMYGRWGTNSFCHLIIRKVCACHPHKFTSIIKPVFSKWLFLQWGAYYKIK